MLLNRRDTNTTKRLWLQRHIFRSHRVKIPLDGYCTELNKGSSSQQKTYELIDATAVGGILVKHHNVDYCYWWQNPNLCSEQCNRSAICSLIQLLPKETAGLFSYITTHLVVLSFILHFSLPAPDSLSLFFFFYLHQWCTLDSRYSENEAGCVHLDEETKSLRYTLKFKIS